MLPLYRSVLLITLGLYLSACASLPQVTQGERADNAQACIVLVHGLWRSGAAMDVIARDLRHHGYQTVTVDYPSTSATIPELAEKYLHQGVESCRQRGVGQIHMVSHSMGGILVRQYLQTRRLPEGSRVVMLSPPNKGSELSTYFANSRWYEWLVGPAGASLIQGENGFLAHLAPIEEPVGVIAAYRSWSLWPEAWLPSPNDGTVSLRSMLLDEMDDLALVNAGHAMMRHKDETHQLIRRFLKYGAFIQPDDIAESKYQDLLRSVSTAEPDPVPGI